MSLTVTKYWLLVSYVSMHANSNKCCHVIVSFVSMHVCNSNFIEIDQVFIKIDQVLTKIDHVCTKIFVDLMHLI